MRAALSLLLVSTTVDAFSVSGLGVVRPARAATPAMQTIAPERESTIPDSLPSSWTVPDTFSLADLKRPSSDEPPMYRLTLFRSGDAVHMANALLDVIPLEKEKAVEVADTAARVGLSLVGVWEQGLCETYSEELRRGYNIACDVSKAE